MRKRVQVMMIALNQIKRGLCYIFTKKNLVCELFESWWSNIFK